MTCCGSCGPQQMCTCLEGEGGLKQTQLPQCSPFSQSSHTLCGCFPQLASFPQAAMLCCCNTWQTLCCCLLLTCHVMSCHGVPLCCLAVLLPCCPGCSGANELDIGDNNDLDVCLELSEIGDSKEERGEGTLQQCVLCCAGGTGQMQMLCLLKAISAALSAARTHHISHCERCPPAACRLLCLLHR